MARLRGDVEIRDALGRRWENVIGSAIDPTVVPAILAGVHGFTAVTEVIPEPTGDQLPAHQWTGSTADGVTVTAKLWPEPAYDPNGGTL